MGSRLVGRTRLPKRARVLLDRDFPSVKQGDVLMVEFTVMGIPCLGLNGGPQFKHNEAFSFQVATADQAETDRYWNAIVGHGGQESACGWCKDKWGVSWQITPVPDRIAASVQSDRFRRQRSCTRIREHLQRERPNGVGHAHGSAGQPLSLRIRSSRLVSRRRASQISFSVFANLWAISRARRSPSRRHERVGSLDCKIRH